MAENLQVSVVTPVQEFLEQETAHASIPAHDGEVGLLPGHGPMLVKLGYGPMHLGRSGEEQSHYFIGGGFAQVKDDKLTVLTEEAQPLSELNADQAQQDLDEALQAWAGTESEKKQRSARVERARAMVHLSRSSA